MTEGGSIMFTIKSYVISCMASLAAALSSIGISHPLLFWATLGTYPAIVISKHFGGRLKSIAVFCCSSFSAALFGQVVSTTFFSSNETTSFFFAVVGGFVLQPALSELSARSPDIVTAITDKLIKQFSGAGSKRDIGGK